MGGGGGRLGLGEMWCSEGLRVCVRWGVLWGGGGVGVYERLFNAYLTGVNNGIKTEK